MKMNNNVMVISQFKFNHIGKCLLIMVAFMVAFGLFSHGHTAMAAGAEQISGIAYFDDTGTCDDPITNEAGASPDFALIMTGDLEGCLYTFVETFECHPGGTYKETGNEIFVGDGSPGNDGTFTTSYQVIAKFNDCPNLADQIWGMCHHPIVANSGTGDYEGVRGRFDIKDDLVAGNYPYTGHLQFE